MTHIQITQDYVILASPVWAYETRYMENNAKQQCLCGTCIQIMDAMTCY